MVVQVVFTSSMTTAIIIMWPGTIMCDEVLQVYKTFANMSCSLYAFSIRNTQTILRCGLALNTGELLWIFLRRILLITLIFNIRKQKLFTTSTTPLEPRRPSLIPDTQNSLWPSRFHSVSQKVFGKMTPMWEKWLHPWTWPHLQTTSRLRCDVPKLFSTQSNF